MLWALLLNGHFILGIAGNIRICQSTFTYIPTQFKYTWSILTLNEFQILHNEVDYEYRNKIYHSTLLAVFRSFLRQINVFCPTAA